MAEEFEIGKNSSGPFAKQGSAQSHHCAALFNCNAKIVAHSHAKLAQGKLLSKPLHLLKKRPCLPSWQEGGHAEQAPYPEIWKFLQLTEEGGQFTRLYTKLCFLFCNVHFHKNREGLLGRIIYFPGEFQAVDCLDARKKLHCFLCLVALQMPNEMPLCVFRQLAYFFLSLLQIVLAAKGDASIQSSLDFFNWLALGCSQDFYSRGVSTRSSTGGIGFLPCSLQVLGNQGRHLDCLIRVKGLAFSAPALS